MMSNRKIALAAPSLGLGLVGGACRGQEVAEIRLLQSQGDAAHELGDHNTACDFFLRARAIMEASPYPDPWLEGLDEEIALGCQPAFAMARPRAA